MQTAIKYLTSYTTKIIILSYIFNEAPFMRVLAINDISCTGKCSLTVALPILSACGAACDIMPTALLSTHTGGFEGYTFLDLSQEMQKIADHWESLGLKFDLIYSGYLGSRSQIQFVKDCKKRFLKEKGVFVVDPVLGDHFTFYKGFDQAFAQEMKSLCAEADYILPNETESFLLTGERNFSAALKKLGKICPCPVITGAQDEKGYALRYLHENRECVLPLKKIEGAFHGAGDVFASAFCGCVLNGLSMESALSVTADFCYRAIARSEREVKDRRFGLAYERELGGLISAISNNSL